MNNIIPQRYTLIYLAFWHMLIIALSNYLVQFPFQVGPLYLTPAAFTFPFIFLTTDLTVRIFGRPAARRIIFCAMLPALLLSYWISMAFQDGQWTHVAALITWDTFVARIALASFLAYLVGQLLDITIFDRLRRSPKWYLAPACSTIFGSMVDTLVFFFVSFFRSSDAYMAAHWLHLGFWDYLSKISISMLFFLPAYGVLLRVLTQRLTRQTEQNPASAA